MSLSLKPAGIVSAGETHDDPVLYAQPGESLMTISIGDRQIVLLVDTKIMRDETQDAFALKLYFAPALAALRSTGAFDLK